jgi:signal transduction histidine kinase
MQDSCRLDQLKDLQMMRALSTRLSLKVHDRIDRLKFEKQNEQHSQNLYSKFSIIKMVEETERLLMDVMGMNGSSIEIVAQNLPEKLFGDATRIKQVLTNLIENGILYATCDKTIILKIKYLESREIL